MRIARAAVPLAVLLGGCLAAAPTDQEMDAPAIGAANLWLSPGRPEGKDPTGWPAETSSVARQTATADSTGAPQMVYVNGAWQSFTMLEVRSRLYAFSSRDRKLTLSVSQRSVLDWFRSLQGTTFGVILYHRPAGTRHAWVPLHCGAYAEGHAPLNAASIGYHTGQVQIDLDGRAISFPRAGDGLAQTASFETCGVVEPYPEIAARVMPASVDWSWRFHGSYDYDLWASCDGRRCSAYDSNERANDESLGVANLPFLGLSVVGVPEKLVEDLASELGTERWQGAVILPEGLVADSPAAQGGLRPLDVILEIDGTPINPHNLSTVVQACSKGQVLAVRIVRADLQTYGVEHMTLQVQVGFTEAPGEPPGR